MRGRAEAARQAHNLKVIGSNPIPATSNRQAPENGQAWRFLVNKISNNRVSASETILWD